MNFPFDENPNVAILTCFCVLHEGRPILYVSHDLDDGMWQFLCGQVHTEDAGMTVSLFEIYELDNSVAALAGLPLGCEAKRQFVGDKWTARSKNISGSELA